MTDMCFTAMKSHDFCIKIYSVIRMHSNSVNQNQTHTAWRFRCALLPASLWKMIHKDICSQGKSSAFHSKVLKNETTKLLFWSSLKSRFMLACTSVQNEVWFSGFFLNVCFCCFVLFSLPSYLKFIAARASWFISLSCCISFDKVAYRWLLYFVFTNFYCKS